MGLSLVVHGHFYQPPRENPWLGTIERQDSARPYHDWNERIAAECYTPNAFARILDDDGRILDIVNNYEFISFNFGPTLLEWLEERAPDTYARILDADRRSLAARGHGNAIAQAYNHTILPLCNERDRRTQLRWGVADFERRFGRRPEAMWLPETAMSPPVIDALLDEGLRFVILSPHQAEAVRDGDRWVDVSGGTIDPTRPYRLLASGGRPLDVFFYDGPVSSAIGFEGALGSSRGLVDRLACAAQESDRDLLVHVATDGESYGHHTRFGERTLAYALAVEAPRRGFAVTNYAAWLDAHPPTVEVRLKPGPNGEGTAWSCAHGLGRWLRDCGCRDGARGWSQAWRGPLRRALDLVRDRCATLFERRGATLFRDPWAARDEYLAGRAQIHAFLEAHALHPLDALSRLTALRLLEMERYALLMYTSCGWFFDELSGLETTQILRYAGRAVELSALCDGNGRLEPAFLAALDEARSNLPELGGGAEVYRRFVAASRIGPDRLAAQEAILSLFVRRPRELRVGHYQVRRAGERRAGDARFGLYTGRLTLVWLPTGELTELTYAVLHVGAADVCCAVAPFAGAQHRDAVDTIWAEWSHASIARLLRAIERGIGPAEFTLRDLLIEEREAVLQRVYGELLSGVSAEYARLYDNHRHTMHVLRDAGLPIPEPLRQAAETVLGARFEAEIKRQKRSRDPTRYRRAIEMAEDARKRGLNLARPEAQRAFAEMLGDLLAAIAAEPRPVEVREALQFFELARRLGIDAVSPRAQELLYATLSARPNAAAMLAPLAHELGFAPLSEPSLPHQEVEAGREPAQLVLGDA
jgi:alpha-amylase/alpha-mannosidase (GH57 family)